MTIPAVNHDVTVAAWPASCARVALFLDHLNEMSTAAQLSLPRAALWIVAVVAVIFLVRSASQLLIPIACAVLIAYVLEPIVSGLVAHRVPRTAATTIVMLAVLGIAGWSGCVMRDDALQAVRALPQAAERARELMTSSGVTNDEPQEERTRESAELPLGVTSAIQSVAGSALTFFVNLTVVYFLCFFLLLSGHHVKTRILETAGRDSDRRERLATIIGEIDAQIQRFLVVRLITAAVVGAVTWAVLAWMGVANAAVWGTAAAVFNSIPYFGPIIVSGGLFVVGLVQEGNLVQGFTMAGVALLITTLEGWLLTPSLMGKAENMSALAVFLGLLVWTWLWGAWGTILAVPMLVIIKAVVDHTPSLTQVGRFMAR